MTLGDYLRSAGAGPFRWGEVDCCLFGADWIAIRRGIDPAAPLRGRYRTRLGAVRHIRRAGGFEPMVRTLLQQAGLALTDHPAAGDVGLIVLDQGPLIAISTGAGRWAMKAPDGLVVAPLRHHLAWSV